jgi:hypothetical protein
VSEPGENEIHINRLRQAEQQFRLAATVNLAVTFGVQSLDVPIEWTYEKFRVSHQDFGLRQDQAEYAAAQLEWTTVFIIAGAVRDALIHRFGDPKNDANQYVIPAYQFSRMLRNAFSHNMLRPVWSIDKDCSDKEYRIGELLSWRTHGLNGRPVEWSHFGGPLAMFHFVRFVRVDLLGAEIDPNRQPPPEPKMKVWQQGRLVARKLD